MEDEDIFFKEHLSERNALRPLLSLLHSKPRLKIFEVSSARDSRVVAVAVVTVDLLAGHRAGTRARTRGVTSVAVATVLAVVDLVACHREGTRVRT